MARSVLTELRSAGVSGSSIVYAPMLDPVPFQLQATAIQPVGLVGGEVPTLIADTGLYRFPGYAQLWELYEQTLAVKDPTASIDRYGGRPGLAEVFGLRNWSPLVFSIPEKGDPLAGATFALEFATVVRSTGLGRMVVSDQSDTYAVRMPDNRYYGVVEGLPTAHCETWPTSLGKHVHAHLAAPRGRAYEAKGFTVVDRLAHWLYLNPDTIPDTESCLAALTPLRLTGTPLQFYDYEQELFAIQPKQQESARPMLPKAIKAELLEQALQLFDTWMLDDRQRMVEIFSILVPDVCSEAHFFRRIADIEAMPSLLSKKAIERAKTAIQKLYSIGNP